MGYSGGGPPPPPLYCAKSQKQRLYAWTWTWVLYLHGADRGAVGERFCQPSVVSVLVLNSPTHLHANDAAVGIDVYRA